MIISVKELKKYITTDVADAALEFAIQALETSIREQTHNQFQNTRVRAKCEATERGLEVDLPRVAEGDTIQISQSKYNDGLYTVAGIYNGFIDVDQELYPEAEVLVTKVEYPADVKMGVIEIMRWKLQNQDKNNPVHSKNYIASESISRYSVTYSKDSTEEDIDEKIGAPKKYTSFIKRYTKARF